jgi:hypothetical protein
MKIQTLTKTNFIQAWFTGTLLFPHSFNYKERVSYKSDPFCLFFLGVEGYCFVSLHTWTHTHSVEVLWTRDRPISETSTYKTQNLHKRHTSIPLAGFKTRNPSKRAATGLCCRPFGHWDRCRFYVPVLKNVLQPVHTQLQPVHTLLQPVHTQLQFALSCSQFTLCSHIYFETAKK